MKFGTPALLSVLVTICALSACGNKMKESPPPSPHQPAILSDLSRVWIADEVLHLRVAADFDSRGQGLGGISSLPGDGGMIFVYQDSSSRHFWMKDCLIGLDIAFVDENRRVMAVHSLDPPGPATTDETMPRAGSDLPVRFVIETNKGFFAAKGLGVGDQIKVSDELLRLARLGAHND